MNITLSEYRKRFGAALKEHENESWFVNLLLLLESEHPLRKVKQEKADGQLLAGATVYLNSILGFQEALDVIDRARSPDVAPPVEPEAEYPNEN